MTEHGGARASPQYYHRSILRRLPAQCDAVLDVGCGSGELAIELARRARRVDALDRSPEMIRRARPAVPSNVMCLEADVLDPALQLGPYDAVTSVATLHHLPLSQALPRLAGWLKPGGVLVAVALPRIDLPREAPVEAGAVALHNLTGLALQVSGGRPLGRCRPAHDDGLMPVLDPELTVREVRDQVVAALPGARVRRLVLWRYLLVWRKPR